MLRQVFVVTEHHHASLAVCEAMKIVPQRIGPDDIPAFDRFTVGRSRLSSGDNAQRSDDRAGRDHERDAALRFIVLFPSVATHGESRSEQLTVVTKGIPGMPGIWIVIPRHAPGWRRHYSLDSSATSRVANACSAHHAARELLRAVEIASPSGCVASRVCIARKPVGQRANRWYRKHLTSAAMLRWRGLPSPSRWRYHDAQALHLGGERKSRHRTLSASRRVILSALEQ